MKCSHDWIDEHKTIKRCAKCGAYKNLGRQLMYANMFEYQEGGTSGKREDFPVEPMLQRAAELMHVCDKWGITPPAWVRRDYKQAWSRMRGLRHETEYYR